MYKLGKLPRKQDNRTLLFEKYATALPIAPKSSDWSHKLTKWGMLANDTVGDCTCAAAGHHEMCWLVNNGITFDPTDQQVLAAYSAITGYNPITGANDNGATCLDVLNYWRKTGIAGHTIGAFAQIALTNHTQVKQAVWLFGGAYIGVALPISAQGQKTWKVTTGPDAEPGSWGGHCVPVIHYTSTYLYFVSWGSVYKMTWGFWSKYVDEAYCIISPDFLIAGKAPNGFDMATLQSDLANIGK